MSWWRKSRGIQKRADDAELFVKYPWWSALFVGLMSFFFGAIARPMGLMDKGRSRPSQTMARTPEAFWEIVIASAVVALAFGCIFHQIRARRRKLPGSSPR